MTLLSFCLQQKGRKTQETSEKNQGARAYSQHCFMTCSHNPKASTRQVAYLSSRFCSRSMPRFGSGRGDGSGYGSEQGGIHGESALQVDRYPRPRLATHKSRRRFVSTLKFYLGPYVLLPPSPHPSLKCVKGKREN